MLHSVYSYLDDSGGNVRVIFFNFSSAFNTIRPSLLEDKHEKKGVDPQIEEVCLWQGGEQHWCTTLAPFLFTLYTIDFVYNSRFCHFQNYLDDTAIVAYIRNGREDEYKQLMEAFREWSDKNSLLLNTAKTKEMVVDFRSADPECRHLGGGDLQISRWPLRPPAGLALEQRLCTREDGVHCISSGGWGPLVSVVICSTYSTRQLWWVYCFMPLSAEYAASGKQTGGAWGNWWKRLRQ